MPKYTVEGTGERPTLNNNTYKTKGGEGSIHIKDGTVYKICEPGKMIPESKFQELQKLDHPKIIKPDHRILDAKGNPCGYTMRLVPGDAQPLARILTKQYREREGVNPEIMKELVRQIVEGTRFIHSHDGYLIVDANEYNFMVPTDTYKAVYFIDTNSYQTPNHPATAIMASIRDLTVKQDGHGVWQWSQESDWYSMAILTWYMFTAIHPYKGDHPKYTDVRTFWQDQMRDNVSVLRDDVTVPVNAVYHPFEDVIPGGAGGAFMQWYRAIFLEGKRVPAPKDWQEVISFVAAVREIAASNFFDLKLIHELSTRITGYYARSGREIIVTKEHIINSGIKWKRPKNRFRCGFSPVMNIPYSCEFLDDGKIRLTNLNDGEDIPIDLSGHDIMSTNGRVYVLGYQNIFEITFIEKKNFFVANNHEVASVLPNATTMYQGCALQDMFGQFHFSIFPDTKMHYQFTVDELDDYQIIDAKYEGGVLMVVAMDQNGQYDRFVLRVKRDEYEVFRKVENINPTGLNFTVNDKDVCVCINESEKVEFFSAQKGGRTDVKEVDDPAISSDMRLCHHGNTVQFAHGRKVFSFAVRK